MLSRAHEPRAAPKARAELAAVCACLSHNLAGPQDAAHPTEVHRQAMKQTKQRAAQMLARTEAALLATGNSLRSRLSR